MCNIGLLQTSRTLQVDGYRFHILKNKDPTFLSALVMYSESGSRVTDFILSMSQNFGGILIVAGFQLHTCLQCNNTATTGFKTNAFEKKNGLLRIFQLQTH